MQVETTVLPGDSPGAQRALTLCRYGRAGQGPVVYLQAGLHADEMPGVLVLQHLMDLLDQAETDGRIAGEIRVVPAANPIGLGQWAFQRPLGRLEAETTHNFNRGYPDLAELVGDALDGQLTQNAAQNLNVIRAAFGAALDAVQTRTDMQAMRVALMRWSHDADFVLDLHCDHFAVMHLYASPARPEDASLLSRSVGAELALIAEVSGGNSFDEAHTAPWASLQKRFEGRFPIPSGCFSSTLEYRGQFDVDDVTAMADARNLMTFLAGIGAIAGWTDAPAFADAVTHPLTGSEDLYAPQGGVVTWAVAPGARVFAGETVAYVTDPVTRNRMDVATGIEGILFRQELWRSCLRGQSLGSVSGAEPRRTGNLMSD